MKSILKAVFVVIGTIIGAGFASGQEIWLFFNQYGSWGAAGMMISCFISGIIIYQVFQMIERKNITTYEQLLSKISSRKILNHAISIIISIFLLISFYIMVAGMSALFQQEFGIPIWICASIMAAFCYFILQRDMKGIMAVNSVLMPALILFILYLGVRNLDFATQHFNIKSVQNSNNWQWICSSILYASYNSITLVPMLVELKPYITSKSKKISIICGILLTLLGISLFGLLLRGNEMIYRLELPMIEIVKEFGAIYTYLYEGVVVTAIFTTAISAGYGFLKSQVAKQQFSKGDIAKREKAYYQKVLLIICISAPFIANIGFSNLVSKLYPIFGILGLIQVVALLRYRK